MPRVMLSCGEASGDLYAGALARELEAMAPGTEVFGFGGPRLAEAGADLVGDYRGLSVTGLVEVVRLLPKTYAMYRRLVEAARVRRPDVFVAIDFPDFNFRLAGAIRRLGIPVVYYISPQLWAWRRGRMATLKRLADRVLVIFPFESSIYEHAGVPVEFVGHPLVDLVRPAFTREALLAAHGLVPEAPTIALLPGSRPNEVRQILPTLVESAERLVAMRPGMQFLLARAPHLDLSLFAPLDHAIDRGALRVAVVDGDADSVLAASDVVVTASGTATVQTALHEKPMVIVYRLSPLTYRLGIRFVQVDTYGMVNLVAGRRVVPELIQDGFTASAVIRDVLRYFDDPVHYDTTRAELRTVKEKLGGGGASRRVANAVLRVAGVASPATAVVDAATG